MEGGGFDREFVAEDVVEQIDWNDLFLDDVGGGVLDLPETETTTSSPGDACSFSSLIGQIENQLMKDNDDDNKALPVQDEQFYDEFCAAILVDSPLSSGGGEVLDVSSADKDSGASDKPSASPLSEKETETEAAPLGEDPDDHSSRKLRRQLRNRDAAVRSRERKKMYVKDLEMKSKYLEGECRRLSRLLQCFIAENQALRVSLHKGSALGVTSAKQESAVLLLESLLLGSLLWFLGIMCLFITPRLPQPTLAADPLESGGEKVPKEVSQRGAKSRMFVSPMVQSFVISKRCKASRTRIKPGSHFFHVLV